MGSFPVSIANNFCDKLLPKYLVSKTVLIYCPHPVLDCSEGNTEEEKSGYIVFQLNTVSTSKVFAIEAEKYKYKVVGNARYCS
jgi:hypothetical protein